MAVAAEGWSGGPQLKCQDTLGGARQGHVKVAGAALTSGFDGGRVDEEHAVELQPSCIRGCDDHGAGPVEHCRKPGNAIGWTDDADQLVRVGVGCLLDQFADGRIHAGVGHEDSAGAFTVPDRAGGLLFWGDPRQQGAAACSISAVVR